MSHVSESVRVPYTPQQMFDLVDDVERYPEFLPGCLDARIEKQEGHVQRATLDLAFAGFQRSITTRNERMAGERIDLELVRGPFRYLRAQWRFEATEDGGCRVSLAGDYELRNRMLAWTVGSAIERFSGSLVEAFRRRAEAVYGSR